MSESEKDKQQERIRTIYSNIVRIGHSQYETPTLQRMHLAPLSVKCRGLTPLARFEGFADSEYLLRGF